MHVASQTVPYGASGEHGFERRMLVESRQIRKATKMSPGMTADLPHLIFFGSWLAGVFITVWQVGHSVAIGIVVLIVAGSITVEEGRGESLENFETEI